MEKKDIENLVRLRQKTVEFYQSLDGGQQSSTAVMKQEQAALMLETIVRSLDDLLSEHVKFE